MFEKLSSIVGAIQSNPAYDEEGNLKYKGGYPGQGSFIDPFDLIPGLGAVGASIRGGKVAKQAFNPTIKKMMNKLFSGKKGKKLLKSEFTPDELEWMRKRDAKKALEKIQERNMLSKARMQLKQTQDKYKIADPDKAEYLDTISALLTKWSKN